MTDDISRRRLLTVTSSATAGLGLISNTGAATQSTETILQEGFENASEQTRPPDWTKSGNGVALVVVPDGGNSVSGSKIFGMFGRDNSCTSVSVSHALDLEDRTWARFRAYVFPTDRGQDNCTSRRAGLSLQTANKESVPLVELMTDGTVRGPKEEPLGEYAEATWNELVVEYDRSGESVELSYTINGDSRGTISKPHHAKESDLSQFRLDTGVDIVWWDALKVTANAKTETSTSSPDESGTERGGSSTNPLGGAPGATDIPWIPQFGIFNMILWASGAVVTMIFLLLALVNGSGSSRNSNTRSSRRLTEDEVRDGLEDTEESLRDRKR